MILGEGAAFFVLEREKDMLRRNAIPLAIAGRCGLSADAHHPTAPRSDGAGMAISMSHALSRQGLRPEQIDWVCAHGSGTMLSDNAEALAIRDVFGSQMSVSALKGALGHALAAASAIEAAICILSLRHQCIPPSINFEEPDPAIDIRILDKPSYQPIRWVMNCGYAFGGLNSSLIIGKWN